MGADLVPVCDEHVSLNEPYSRWPEQGCLWSDRDRSLT